MDLFKNFELDSSFITAVNSSYHSNDWEAFISEFGTHFITEVIMGGRAVQEIVYNFESMSQLNSLDIDIGVAAKARFGMFYGDKSTDWHQYEEQVNYTQFFTN